MLKALNGHEFWPDDISLCDSEKVDSQRMLDSAQVTDAYLLALAAARRGQLATFDRRLVSSAVPNAFKALFVIR